MTFFFDIIYVTCDDISIRRLMCINKMRDHANIRSFCCGIRAKHGWSAALRQKGCEK